MACEAPCDLGPVRLLHPICLGDASVGGQREREKGQRTEQDKVSEWRAKRRKYMRRDEVNGHASHSPAVLVHDTVLAIVIS